MKVKKAKGKQSNELDTDNYKEFFFSPREWKHPEDMLPMLRKMKSGGIIYLFLGVILLLSLIVLSNKFDIGLIPRIVVCIIFIMLIYLGIDIFLMRGYWLCYKEAWTAEKASDVPTVKKRRRKNIVYGFNIPWIIFVTITKKLFIMGHMKSLYIYGFQIFTASTTAIAISLIIGLGLVNCYMNFVLELYNRYPDYIGVKTFAYGIIFLTFTVFIFFQRILLFSFTRNTSKSKKEMKIIRSDIFEKLDRIGLIFALTLSAILNILEYKVDTTRYIMEGFLYTSAIFTAWLSLKEKLKSE